MESPTLQPPSPPVSKRLILKSSDGLELPRSFQLLHTLLVLLKLLPQIQELISALIPLLEAVKVYSSSLLLLRGLASRGGLRQRDTSHRRVAVSALHA